VPTLAKTAGTSVRSHCLPVPLVLTPASPVSIRPSRRNKHRPATSGKDLGLHLSIVSCDNICTDENWRALQSQHGNDRNSSSETQGLTLEPVLPSQVSDGSPSVANNNVHQGPSQPQSAITNTTVSRAADVSVFQNPRQSLERTGGHSALSRTSRPRPLGPHSQHAESFLGDTDTGFLQVYGPEHQSDANTQALHANIPLEFQDVPSPDLLQSFAETYFDCCYAFCPVLDKDSLFPDLAQSPLLSNALALVGSHIQPPMIPHAGPATYYDRARKLFYDDGEPQVITALKAVSLFYWWSPRPPSIVHRHSSWWWTSVVIRHGQQMGMHREPAPGHPLTAEGGSMGIRRRIWWTAFVSMPVSRKLMKFMLFTDPLSRRRGNV